MEKKPKRPETLNEFIKEIEKIKKINEKEPKKSYCKSCEDSYPAKLKVLTEGYCIDCAMELFYGRLSTGGVRNIDNKKIKKSIEAFKARPYQVRAKWGKHSN
ncbi:hypothetical protein KY304_01920 [Candidatus Woesearchaeota archaeon]|nr:hypothetical protein [Candidatus Woesearchaeota archaeon]MBW2978846.1 hypothetical protein [Candidatus Woesearchaeota archaeon]